MGKTESYKESRTEEKAIYDIGPVAKEQRNDIQALLEADQFIWGIQPEI